MHTDVEICYLSALELTRRIRDRDLSCGEVIDAYLRRIDSLNPQLRAIVQIDADGARRAAAAADASVSRGDDLGALHGVPFTVKDWIETEGLICAAGMEERRAYVPPGDATVVARMRSAGAILLGKAKSGIEADVYPAARNPYDLARTAGGSSSGDCVAVASGLSAIGLGSDSGGSLRLPAHYCGIATIKPTTGRVPNTGHFQRIGDMSDPRTVIGPIARAAGDLWEPLRVVAGPDGRDPGAVPVPLCDPAQVQLRGLRAAVYTDMPEASATKDTAATVASAGRVLDDAGVELHPDRPPRIEESLHITRDYWARSSSVSWKTWYPSHEHRLKSAEDVERAIFEWERLRRDFIAWMEHYDLIVCPVSADIAGVSGSVIDTTFVYTLPYSLTGYPCAVVRGGTSVAGVPIGVQIIARPWREDVAIAAACAVERVLGGWKQPPEPVSA